MAKFCAQCGAALREGAKFCAGCGKATGDMPAPQQAARQAPTPEPVAPFSGPAYLAPPPGATPSPPGSFSAPPGATVTPPLSNTAGAGLPPAPALWPMQSSLMKTADRLCGQLEKSLPSKQGFGRAIHRMVRAALLDQNTYREVAMDPSANAGAGACAAIATLCASAGPALLSLLKGNGSLLVVLGLLAAAAFSFAGFVVASYICAQSVVGRRVDPVALFRAVAYAQAPGIVCLIPVVGLFLGLWCLVTTTAAIKDSLGCDTGNAVVLMIVGAIGAGVVWTLLGPVIVRTFVSF